MRDQKCWLPGCEHPALPWRPWCIYHEEGVRKVPIVVFTTAVAIALLFLGAKGRGSRS